MRAYATQVTQQYKLLCSLCTLAFIIYVVYAINDIQSVINRHTTAKEYAGLSQNTIIIE